MENQDESVLVEPCHSDSSGKEPRYYQIEAINRTIEAITRGQKRVLLVMATGTGKTYTTFQIIWRLWKAKAARRILYLADRNILVDQTLVNDFKPFGAAMAKIKNRKIVCRLCQVLSYGYTWVIDHAVFTPDLIHTRNMENQRHSSGQVDYLRTLCIWLYRLQHPARVWAQEASQDIC